MRHECVSTGTSIVLQKTRDPQVLILLGLLQPLLRTHAFQPLASRGLELPELGDRSHFPLDGDAMLAGDLPDIAVGGALAQVRNASVTSNGRDAERCSRQSSRTCAAGDAV